MSYNREEGFANMVNAFRTNDLQLLLGSFGRNKAGRKNELKERALELLRNKPTGFNFNAYCSTILEIYRTLKSEVVPPTSNNGMRNLMQNQQRQMMSSQPQQQRMFPPPRYPPQMRMPRPGLPQVMPRMTRGMYRNNMGANNNRFHYVYQQNLPRNVRQVPPNQQFTLMVSNAIVYDLNAPESQDTSNLPPLPPGPPLDNITLRKLPFYEILDDVMKPKVLIGYDRPNGFKEIMYKFRLTSENATLIGINRDVSPGLNEYVIQAQIRICYLEPGVNEITDLLPLEISLRINGKHCAIPSTGSNANKPGTESRRPPRPINCSHYLKLNPNIQNTVCVNWKPDGKTYVISVYLVRKLNSEILIQNLQEKRGRSSEETKNFIIKKLQIDDPDLATTSYRVSLVCPLGKIRMSLPAISIHCNHILQCFDASVFILMNEKKPTWTCPTCNNKCLYDDIQVQSYFMDVISSPVLTDSCKEIEVLPDGTWRVYEENENNFNSSVNKRKPIDSVNLDSDDDGPKEVKPAINDLTLKSSFVDLTLSDDEGEMPFRAKQENEAQAANAKQIPTTINVKPQAQVQPKQAVTSSEQGDVIEIGSPTPPSSPNPPSATS